MNSFYIIKNNIKIKHNIRAEKKLFLKNFYLINAHEAPLTVVAYRDDKRRLVRGDSIAEISDISELNELKTYLFSYSKAPFVMSTDEGIAVIYGNIFSSTLLFSATFIDPADENDFLCALFSGKLSGYSISGKIMDKKAKRSKAREPSLRLTTVFNITTKALDCSRDIRGLPWHKCDLFFKNSVQYLSSISGCSASLELSENTEVNESFDIAAFKSFVLAMLMVAREESKERKADIRIACCNEGISVSITFDSISDIDLMSIPSVLSFRQFAERNNMIFDFLSQDSLNSVRFCPSRKDWSYIELKHKLDFKWDL